MYGCHSRQYKAEIQVSKDTIIFMFSHPFLMTSSVGTPNQYPFFIKELLFSGPIQNIRHTSEIRQVHSGPQYSEHQDKASQMNFLVTWCI